MLGRDRYFARASRTCPRDCLRCKWAKHSPLKRPVRRQSIVPRYTARRRARSWSDESDTFLRAPYEIRSTSDATFLASPLEGGERIEVRGLQIFCLFLPSVNPHPPPLPVQGEATQGRAAQSI